MVGYGKLRQGILTEGEEGSILVSFSLCNLVLFKRLKSFINAK
jgi:hypothetical protein